MPNATANANYYVAISAADPTNGRNVGNYFLGIDFQTALVQQQQFAELTLTNSAKQAGRVLTLTSTQAFHFALSASNVNSSAVTAVRMTIYDSNGNVVFSLVAGNGQTAHWLAAAVGGHLYDSLCRRHSEWLADAGHGRHPGRPVWLWRRPGAAARQTGQRQRLGDRRLAPLTP